MSMDRRFFVRSAGVLALGGGASSLLGGALFAQEAPTDQPVIADMVKGSEDAPVTVIEYASFTCPHCRSFHEEMWPEIQSRFIDTGQVRFIYREVYFDRPGLWASMVARCGGQEKFFGIVDLIFTGQSTVFAGDGPQIADSLKQLGLVAGIDPEELAACMSDGEMAQDLVGWYNANREADSVESTPTFLIDGVQLEGNWVRDLVPAIEAAVTAAS